ncbi:MAG: DUF4363 family protein [Ruminococcus sp.]|nr:DUF4363 family protein [Ruminococcus sp.]
MTRVKISAAILSLLILTGIISGTWVNIECSRLIALADETAELYGSGASAEAAAAAEKLERAWESFRKAAVMLVKNERLSEADRICMRIGFYAKNGYDELIPELIELHHVLEQIRDGETPMPSTVL